MLLCSVALCIVNAEDAPQVLQEDQALRRFLRNF